MLTIAKIRKVNNSVVPCDRVEILVLYTSSDGRLSIYHVSLNSFVYFQRYAPDKHFIAKIKKESNSVNTVNRVMVLTFCDFPYSFLSLFQVSFIYLQYF